MMERKILVAYDGSDLSKKAIQEAELQTAVTPDSEVYILSVVSQTGLMTTYPTMAFDVEREMARDLQVELGEVKKRFIANNTIVHAEVIIYHRQRNSGQAIAEYASKNDIDLIIIGSRGLGGVKGTVLGSVSNQVVQHAACHVFVVK